MSHYHFDAPKIGKIETLKPFRRVDSRECKVCGAVAGRCEHLESDEDIVWMSKGIKDRPLNPVISWTPEQRETIKRLFLERGLNYSEIAEVMNTTRQAISGILWRMGVRR